MTKIPKLLLHHHQDFEGCYYYSIEIAGQEDGHIWKEKGRIDKVNPELFSHLVQFPKLSFQMDISCYLGKERDGKSHVRARTKLSFSTN